MADAPPTVAHVVESCDGGVATLVSMLIGEQRHDPAFRSVHLLVDQNSKSERLLTSTQHVHHYTSSRSPIRAPAVSLELRRKLQAIKPDVVVLHSTFPGFWGRMITGDWKIVYCAHGWAFNRDTNRMSKNLYGVIEAALSRRTHSIVSISHDEFLSANKRGIKKQSHFIIGHGIHPANPAPQPILENLSPRLDLAFIGRFERQKGLDILIDIFDTPELNEINLWLIGGDVRTTNAYEPPPRPNIRRLGWLQSNQIDAVLSQVDALIVPSRWEGFGLVALEAMRNSKPVIANCVGGLAELIEDGVNGLFLNIEDIPACRKMLLSLTREQTARMGAASFADFKQNYTWSQCYGKWRQLLLATASKVGGKTP